MKDKNKTKEKLRLLSLAVEQSAEGIAISDSAGNLLFLNSAFATMHGYTPQELIGKHLSVFHTQEQIPSVTAANRQVQETGEFSGEIWHARHDGTVFPTMMHNSLLCDERGYAIGMIGTLRDITERKRAEETLKEKEGLYRTFINSTSDMVFLKDEQLRNIIVNKAFLEYLGAGEDQVIGKTDFELLSESVAEGCRQTDMKAFMKALESGDVVITEEQNGDRIFETRKFRVKLRDKPFGIGGYIRDITDRKKAEEALKEREKELQIEARNLEEANVALKVLLKRRDEDKTELEDKVLLNIKGLVTPYLEKLKMSGLDKNQMANLTILESNLNEITSTFSHRLSSKFLNFTPTEIQVASLLRQGKTNKEIGELLHSSSRTIAFHRDNIRKKLGLKNKKTNLKSYLLSLR